MLSSVGVAFHILLVNSCKIHMHNPPKKLGMSMGIKQKYTQSLHRMRSALLSRCYLAFPYMFQVALMVYVYLVYEITNKICYTYGGERYFVLEKK